MKAPRLRSPLSPFFALLILASLLAGCATVPITGRTQLNMISDQELVRTADTSFAQFMGLVQQKNAQLTATDSPQAASMLRMVRRVSDRIIDAAGLRSQYAWDVVVVKSRDANAFVMPNGKIVVFAGLLPVASSEAGMAAVLGHEVAHVVARHQAERVSQMLLTQLVVATANVGLAASNSKYRPAIGAALGLGAQFGVLLPFSRLHESEADHIGLLYMAKAGYDPVEAIGLWERMEARGGSGQWDYVSTHPSPATRQAQIQRWLPEARLYYADNGRPLPSPQVDVAAVKIDRDAKSALEPTAARPPIEAGFWARKKASNRENPETTRLVRREACSTGQCFVYETESGRRSVETLDGAIVESRGPDGSWSRFSPPLQAYRWPLRVGDSWSQHVRMDDSSGRSVSTRLRGEVVSYEPVSVPAGTLMTFRVVLSLGGTRFAEAWYSPEARTTARTILYDLGGRSVVTELLDYQKRNDLLGVPAAALVPADLLSRGESVTLWEKATRGAR